MLFSQTRKHKIVATGSAETVGKVKGFVVDPTSRSVVALRVKGHKGGDTLHWADVATVGSDAVTVAAPDAVKDASQAVSDLGGKDNTMVDKRVLSTVGDELGVVTDVEFDGSTGAITYLMVDGAPVPAERLVGVGSWAVVVRTA